MYRFAVVPFALLLVASTAVNAQPSPDRDSVLPRAGTWGAEVSMGGYPTGSLLRFSSPQSAWMLGAAFSVTHRSSSVEGGIFPQSGGVSGGVHLRLGRRWWRGERYSRLQPLMGAGVDGGYQYAAGQRSVSGGIYGEGGTTYFFTPHLSLGATAELNLRYSRASRDATDFSPAMLTEHWTVLGNLVRVGAAVYF